MERGALVDRVDEVTTGSVGVADVVRALGEARRFVALVVVMAVAAVGLHAILAPSRYSSGFIVLPESPSSSGVASLAAQFGVPLNVGGEGYSADFYAELLGTTSVRDSVLGGRFQSSEGVGDVSLLDVLGAKGNTDSRRRADARERLRRATFVLVSRRSGTVQLVVSLADSAISQQVASRYLEVLSVFDVKARSSRGRAERIFAEERLALSAQDVESAERQLLQFLQRNRDLSRSPELQYERERLERRAAEANQLRTSLLQSYEQARLAEVRDLPALTVVSRPSAPLRADSRRLLLKLLVALSGALALCVVATVGQLLFPAVWPKLYR